MAARRAAGRLTTHFHVPYATMLECMNAIRTNVLCMLDNPQAEDKRRECTQDLAVVVLQMVPALCRCGLRLKDIANDSIINALSTMLGEDSEPSGSPYLGLLCAFWQREQTCDDFQKHIILNVEGPMKVFFYGMEEQDESACAKGLESLRKANEELMKQNVEHGFIKTDHVLPVVELTECYRMSLQAPQADRTKIYDDIKFFLSTFMSGCISAEYSHRYDELLGIDSDPGLSEHALRALGAHRLQWRQCPDIELAEEDARSQLDSQNTGQPSAPSSGPGNTDISLEATSDQYERHYSAASSSESDEEARILDCLLNQKNSKSSNSSFGKHGGDENETTASPSEVDTDNVLSQQ